MAARIELGAAGTLVIALHLAGLDPARPGQLPRYLARHLGERGCRECAIRFAEAGQLG